MSDFLETPTGALIHRLANIVGRCEVGEGSRIDAFVTITGNVAIGRYCHIGTGACIFGSEGVVIGDYASLSPGARIFTATEDVGGEWITNPTVPARYRNPIKAPVLLGDHAEMGSGSVALPGADMPEGAFLGALSMTKERLLPWSIYAGVPAKFKKYRTRGALALAADFEQSQIAHFA